MTFSTKTIFVEISKSIYYIGFWCFLLACKLYCSYYLYIMPMIHPTLLLIDSSSNFAYAGLNNLIAFLFWVSLLFIFLFDTQIYFAIFSSILSTLIGINLKIGSVKTFDDLVRKFLSTKLNVCKFFDSSFDVVKNSVIDVSLNKKPNNLLINKKSDPLLQDLDEYAILNWLSPNYDRSEKFEVLINFFQDFKMQLFSTIWNKVIFEIREDDLISNKETYILSFKISKTKTKLPLFILCGCVNEIIPIFIARSKVYCSKNTNLDRSGVQLAFESEFMEANQQNALIVELFVELYESLFWLLDNLLGPKHKKQIEEIKRLLNDCSSYGFSLKIVNFEKLFNLRDVFNDMICGLIASYKTIFKVEIDKSSKHIFDFNFKHNHKLLNNDYVSPNPQLFFEKNDENCKLNINCEPFLLMIRIHVCNFFDAFSKCFYNEQPIALIKLKIFELKEGISHKKYFLNSLESFFRSRNCLENLERINILLTLSQQDCQPWSYDVQRRLIVLSLFF